ncbi:hypothetical protein SAMN05216203_1493 [Marinobacter daqiaonensis]|uniref:DUF3037 domain-containing protein n=1 Tax=Marinobacter daqiaonensis TaxID=650891 RepID=A0A1I6HSK3_9GAMM|nr:hypothetical protein [Marinobacter daqiaonensis]SFR57404.1 hypothetical protein SAMN05216203_1493 [Marinobacter daqiaonensis]
MNFFTQEIGDLAVNSLISSGTQTQRDGFEGIWYSIEIQPDVFVPQWFNVGVAVQNVSGKLEFQILDYFKKFECIYGKKFNRNSFFEIRSHAQEILRNAERDRIPLNCIHFETTALRISEQGYTSGMDITSTTNRLFREIVALEKNESDSKSNFESIDTSKARKLVSKELKRIANMDYEKIVNKENTKRGFEIEYNEEKHFLDVELLTRKACGNIVSAVYKSPQTIELNLLKSSRDLTTFSKIRGINDIGLFLLLPHEGTMSEKEFRSIDQLLKEQEWKLERDGFRVVSLPSEQDLAKEIYDWARPSIV